MSPPGNDATGGLDLGRRQRGGPPACVPRGGRRALHRDRRALERGPPGPPEAAGDGGCRPRRQRPVPRSGPRPAGRARSGPQSAAPGGGLRRAPPRAGTVRVGGPRGTRQAAGQGDRGPAGGAGPPDPQGRHRTGGRATGTGGVQLTYVRGIQVNVQIADQLERMLAAAQADGLAFSGGGYRDPSSQVALRRAHCGTSDYDVYEKPPSQCHPPTAGRAPRCTNGAWPSTSPWAAGSSPPAPARATSGCGATPPATGSTTCPASPGTGPRTATDPVTPGRVARPVAVAVG